MKLRIIGGKPLSGTIRAHGAKNSVLPVLAATVLSGGVCVIENCPDLQDVRETLKILRYIGCSAAFDDGRVTVDASACNRSDIPHELMKELRASFIFLGAILGRTGEAAVSLPGGCDLGQRPVDIHTDALIKMGAEITSEGGMIHCNAKRLRGAAIQFGFPSVGATENIMIAATLAEGVTTISGAACEPEIVDLQNFLNAMGADVADAGTPTVTVRGVTKLHGAAHRVIPDRIAASTYLAAVAAAGGEITVTDVVPEHFASVTAVLRDMGCDIAQTADSVTLKRLGALKARPMTAIHTLPYPGFPTDAQSPIMAVCALAEGTTIFVENIFSDRYTHVGELARMGASIQVEDRVAVVSGVESLRGAPVRCTDLRGGAAVVIAALAARGESVISELSHLDRGYENLVYNLRSLGAEIDRG
ncbi:UDP-N-acetylglucosamine 1-carboxyvinyltransferase 1 [Clostridia bacterium]|nr:UDP-N-acetylglucosamine 1-carboxyvinyltransferase 1 [Clostridia bacterium]